MMIPRQTPLAGAPATVFDKRKREGGWAESTETVALAAGGRDLPARRRGGGLARGLAAKKFGIRGGVQMQDEAEPAACTGGERKSARSREIGLLARELGHDRAHSAAFERFLHGP